MFYLERNKKIIVISIAAKRRSDKFLWKEWGNSSGKAGGRGEGEDGACTFPFLPVPRVGL
jgi:hypothetical protein